MTTNETRPIGSLSCCLDPEAMAAIALQEDAKTSRKMAREARKDAQRDKIVMMRQAAAKLREMASNAIGSAIWQGVAGMASAACSAVGAVSTFRGEQLKLAAEGLRDQPELAKKLGDFAAKRLLTAKLVGETATGGLGAMRSVDPFSIASQYRSAEKAELDTQAEVAGNRAGEQADLENEARRLEGAAAQQLQKLGDVRHAIALAAMKV